MEKIIVVNATAARTGGALTIIKQFIEALDRWDNDKFQFIFFVSHIPETSNFSRFKFYSLGTMSWIDRLLWDIKGFKRFLRKENVKPDLIISFQNTGVNFNSGCPQLIYYHNPFCLIPKVWNPFKRNQRILWFYTNIYPLFVRLHIHVNTFFIVQGDWIKNKFSSKFNVAKDKISVIPPSYTDNRIFTPQEEKPNCYRLFFPATAFVYKNHKLLLNTLNYIKNRDQEIWEKTKLVFTLSLDDIKILGLESLYYKNKDKVELRGYIKDQNELQQQYYIADILVFPSQIETFGLPLLEAASIGKYILCANQEYAHEAIQNYKNVDFLAEDPLIWAEYIIGYYHKDKKKSEESYVPKNKDSWGEIINLMEDLIV